MCSLRHTPNTIRAAMFCTDWSFLMWTLATPASPDCSSQSCSRSWMHTFCGSFARATFHLLTDCLTDLARFTQSSILLEFVVNQDICFSKYGTLLDITIKMTTPIGWLDWRGLVSFLANSDDEQDARWPHQSHAGRTRGLSVQASESTRWSDGACLML